MRAPSSIAGPATRPTPHIAGRLAPLLAGLILSGCGLAMPPPAGDTYDVVLLGGRVIDPASGLDGVRNVGIRGGRVGAVTEAALAGRDTVDARGLMVAPGFIDMHAHGQDEENYRFNAMDGVTTALELEVGTGDVAAWYARRAGGTLINHGVSVGHIPLRIRLMDDPSEWLPSGPAVDRVADDDQIATLRRGIERGLAEGALGVGLGLQYTPGASRWEVLEMFRAAAAYGAPAFVHLRHMGHVDPASSIVALQEVLAASAVTGAPLHVHHVHSIGIHATERLLDMVAEARARGLDVTAEVYPYTAAMTAIESAILAPGWQEMLGADYGDLEWAETGERLTAETFYRYRERGGGVILHFIPAHAKRAALAHPAVVVASDGRLRDGVGHPRTAGTFARVLGRFVRDEGLLDWPEAIRKLSTLPAQRLEARTPDFARKGRVQEGADADLVVFDPATVIDRATFERPATFSEGMRHVLVNGVFVVRHGALRDDVRPGRAVRAPVR
jgi:N-acyl-D-aspartate/D-glutamate deacylase